MGSYDTDRATIRATLSHVIDAFFDAVECGETTPTLAELAARIESLAGRVAEHETAHAPVITEVRMVAPDFETRIADLEYDRETTKLAMLEILKTLERTAPDVEDIRELVAGRYFQKANGAPARRGENEPGRFMVWVHGGNTLEIPTDVIIERAVNFSATRADVHLYCAADWYPVCRVCHAHCAHHANFMTARAMHGTPRNHEARS